MSMFYILYIIFIYYVYILLLKVKFHLVCNS